MSLMSAGLYFRQTLVDDCPTYFDSETRLLDAPMVIRVADQTRPVPFTVRAVVTSSDIEFNVQDIDFGFCTVRESVRRTVTITNKSVLPQQFGFCGVPDVSASFQQTVRLWILNFTTLLLKIGFCCSKLGWIHGALILCLRCLFSVVWRIWSY